MSPRGPRPGDIYLAEFPEHDPQRREQTTRSPGFARSPRGEHEGDVVSEASRRSPSFMTGVRPVLVLAVPSKPRFPVILVAPMTSDRDQPWAKSAPHLYTRLPKGIGGLSTDSILLLDQTRFLDAARVRRFLGPLEKKTFDTVLEQWLALFRN